jgi:hypothetical protein
MDDADKLIAVRLPEPLGDPFSGSIIKLEKDARYIIQLDDSKMDPESAEWFSKEFSKAMKEMFGNDSRRAVILFGTDAKIYNIGEAPEDEKKKDSEAQVDNKFVRPDAPWCL